MQPRYQNLRADKNVTVVIKYDTKNKELLTDHAYLQVLPYT